MRFIRNAGRVARAAHSMWAIYLGIVCLWAPDAIYWTLGIDTSPRLWFLIANALLVYGAVGRLLDQSIDRDTMHSPAWIVAFVVVVGVVGALATADRPSSEPVPSASVATTAIPAEAAFLGHAVPLVAKWEGLRTEAYLDPVGIPTVCYGETKGVALGDRYTPEECRAMLERELLSYRAGLHRHFTAETKAQRLPPTRDAAYTSFAYNVGVAGAGGSTAVRRLNAGNIPGGCEALTWWNKAGGRVLRGLVNRRAEERDLCLVGVRA